MPFAWVDVVQQRPLRHARRELAKGLGIGKTDGLGGRHCSQAQARDAAAQPIRCCSAPVGLAASRGRSGRASTRPIRARGSPWRPTRLWRRRTIGGLTAISPLGEACRTPWPTCPEAGHQDRRGPPSPQARRHGGQGHSRDKPRCARLMPVSTACCTTPAGSASTRVLRPAAAQGVRSQIMADLRQAARLIDEAGLPP